MKAGVLRKKSEAELQSFVDGERQRLLVLRDHVWQKKIKNVREARGVRKNIARALTMLRRN